MTRLRVGFMTRALVQVVIVIAASGCAQGSLVSLTQSYVSTEQTLAGPDTQHFYGM